MHKSRVQATAGIAVVSLTSCFLIPMIWFLTDQLTLFAVTRNLGIEPSTVAVHNYIRSSINIGLTKAELHEKLARITPFQRTISVSTVSGQYCEEVRIYIQLFPASTENWWICFGKDMKVVSADYLS